MSAIATHVVRLSGFALSAIVLAGCDDEQGITGPSPSLLASAVSATAADTGIRDWNALSDEELWWQLGETRYLAYIGLRSPGAVMGFDKGRRLIRDSDWQGGIFALSAVLGFETHAADTLIPWVRGKIRDIETLRYIRRLPFVEYVEPGFIVSEAGFASASWCDNAPWTDQRQIGVTEAGDTIPRIFRAMNVDKAWVYANGDNVIIGLTDTGIQPGQPELTTDFDSDERGARFIEFYSETDPDVTCPHGTHAAGTIAAPKNGRGIVGVAWKANMISVKNANWVVNIAEINAQQSIRTAGNRGSGVIAMAWQTMDWSNTVKNEIGFWYYDRNVAFVGAAGTGDCGGPTNEGNVVFPAELNEVLSVSVADVEDGHRPCKAHYGDGLDVLSYHEMGTTPDIVGGPLEETNQSSNGTAIVAGIAALVRQRYPAMTNLQVYDRIIATAGVTCGMNRSWGPIVNALAAVGGLCMSTIAGAHLVVFYDGDPDWREETYNIAISGGVGPFSIRWMTGETGLSITQGYHPSDANNGLRHIWVEVTDHGAPHPPSRQELYVRVINNMSTGDGGSCPDPQAIDCRP